MLTPGFKKIADSEVQNAPSGIKPLPLLAVVSVARSSNLIHFYRLFYCCFSVCVLAVILPQLFHNLWLLIIFALVVYVGFKFYRLQLTEMFSGEFWVEQGIWQLRGNRVIGSYILAGAVCCWPFMVLLPLRHQQTGKFMFLALTRDSLSPADNARLRTWLRVCFRPKT